MQINRSQLGDLLASYVHRNSCIPKTTHIDKQWLMSECTDLVGNKFVLKPFSVIGPDNSNRVNKKTSRLHFAL